MKPKLLSGLTAATHTPFHADGSLNLDVIPLQSEHMLKNGIQTVFIGGSTGESHSLSLAERQALSQRWTEVTRNTSLRVVVHVGSNCLSDSKVLAAQAQQLGAAAISALAPSYFKPRSLDVLIDCMAEIANTATQTPFYFYDIPSMTNVHFSAWEFLSKAGSRIPSLAGVKFTNSDLMLFQLCLNADAGKWDVAFGSDEYLLAALALGAQGAVGSSYNFAAPIYHRVISAFGRGDFKAAREEQLRSVRLIQLLASFGYMGAAKAVMEMLGVPVGPPRLPNTRLTGEQVSELRKSLEAMGFFEWIAV
jgi:N-acetylneuraminate lyase